MSRSPTVSLRRRKLPATTTSPTPGPRADGPPEPRRNPPRSSRKRRSPPGALDLVDDLALGLRAEAGSSRSLPAVAAASRSSTELMPSASCSTCTRFGPSPGWRSGCERGRASAPRPPRARASGPSPRSPRSWRRGPRRCPGARRILRLCEHVGNAVRQVPDRARGVTIGAHAKRVRTLDLEQFRHPIEARRHLCVVYRHHGFSRVASCIRAWSPRRLD